MAVGIGEDQSVAFDCVFDPKRHATVHVPAMLADAFGFSKSQARRLLEQNGVKVDGEVWNHLTGCLDDFDQKVVQVGKRKFVKTVAATT